ncbi:hypothetical protein IV56_GL001063 [Lacticaseibacillus saniviri JCM 17471 = DSM 24301]|uniref:Uncharacterized protein n=1 Tax=Lacticaseibacillus saniviri JCM 17471 = DSM 24301 TaxID=1293598 RepID=A0A0R2MWN0_9LACO|nr:hypothetical protein IV56_GL001063 [Lacticaseibacillus saniviri JCM 17471 = DSM 24301]
MAVIRNDLASSYFANPSDITQKIGGSDVPYNALAVSETGEFMAFSTYYRRVDYFKAATSSQRNIIFGSNAFGISYYHNFFYVLYSQGVNGIKLNKYDIDGNLVATKDDSQTIITVGDHGNVSNSTQMTYDAAGNIFVVITYATDTPRLYKITTDLQVFQYKLPNISSVVDADILMDNLGNLFLIRYSGSLNSNGLNNLEISKFKNDLTLEWSTLVKGAAVTNVSMDLRGNIYVKNGSMVDVYQQIQQL